MGLVRKPRSLRAQCLSRLIDVRLLCALFAFVFLTSICLLASERISTISKAKTIVGDNLEITPWHLFPKKDLPPSSSYSRALVKFQCTYLSCKFPMSKKTPIQIQNKSMNLQYNSNSCPEFFQWIYEDLAPWKYSKITQDNIEAARRYAAFRVTIVGGRLYVEPYYDCYQSRMMFTIWGLLQLLDRYPGMVPDVDIMFDCMDKPMVERSAYKSRKTIVPPLFRYCSNKDYFDIPFPDWSFWGWTETNIAPWEKEFNEIMVGSKEVQWEMRKPLAYWKGNPDVGSSTRAQLLECNSSTAWGAEILRQNWVAEAGKGYEQSKLSKQCKNRFKIYAEGFAWSVSFKYILSCDSPVLVVSPQYYDFFTRGLVPKEHYWPIRITNLCPSIKFAVEWGNSHPEEAKSIGKGGQRYMQSMNMDTVYDYMFHLISEYSKLQKFKPQIPPSAQEACKASVLCLANPKERDWLKKSMPQTLTSSSPCSMPSPRHDLVMDWIAKKHSIESEIANMEDAFVRKSSTREKLRNRNIEEISSSKATSNKRRSKSRTKKKRNQSSF